MKLAEKNLESNLTQLRRWWSRKYNRPPNDPLCVRQTPAELQLGMFEDLLAQRKELLERLSESMTMQERTGLRDRLVAINEVFGYELDVGEDDLIDEWERDLAEGRAPDLSKKTVG